MLASREVVVIYEAGWHLGFAQKELGNDWWESLAKDAHWHLFWIEFLSTCAQSRGARWEQEVTTNSDGSLGTQNTFWKGKHTPWFVHWLGVWRREGACYKRMLKETQGQEAECKHLGQERAAGMRNAENLWHTTKLSPAGAAIHPVTGDTLGSHGALSACENGIKSPQVNPVLTSPVLLTPSFLGSNGCPFSRPAHPLLWGEGAFGTSGPAWA